MYQFLALTFFLTVFFGLAIAIGLLRQHLKWKLPAKIYSIWITIYILFILFGTGPSKERVYPNAEVSPYKLPWKAGVTRFISQGNKSFTSHRGLHLNAWDFWMSIGTEVLAARSGRVIEVVEEFDGIGLKSNYVLIEHEDGSKAMYAHIKKVEETVKIGTYVRQGQIIAYSGMVGQTINPHLHFVVLNKEKTSSLPITFSDVSDGVPLAGRFYKSMNVLIPTN